MTITSPTSRPSAGSALDVAGEVNSTQVVLDTSVLVADPDSLFSFGACDVVLPLTVLEELDGMKSRSDEVGRAARQVVRTIEELRGGGNLSSAVSLDGGGTLRVELNGLRTDRLADLHLDANKPDNRILAAALGIAGEGSGDVRLISADASLRIKAAAVGIDARDYLRTPSPDSRRAAAGTPATLEVTADLVDKLYEHRHIDLDAVLVAAGPAATADALWANRAVVLRAGSSSALGRVTDGRVRLVPGDLTAWELRPRSKGQFFALDALLDPAVSVVALTGHAGVGKTLLALAAALHQTFEPSAAASYDRLMVLRPVVAVGSQDLGFLPGDVDDKLGPWFDAVIDAVVALGNNVSHRAAKAVLDKWVADGQLTMGAVTYLRGRSLQRTFVLLDEAQNLEPSVAKTTLTRLGAGSKLCVLGDATQIDSPFLSESTNALSVLSDAFRGQPLFAHVALEKGERSATADLAAQLL